MHVFVVDGHKNLTSAPLESQKAIATKQFLWHYCWYTENLLFLLLRVLRALYKTTLTAHYNPI